MAYVLAILPLIINATCIHCNTLELGINAIAGTFCPCGDSQHPCKKGPFNATLDLIELQPFFARTHDSNLLNDETYKINPPYGKPVFNWNNIYDPANIRMRKDPNDPANYNFNESDNFAFEFDILNIPLLLRLGDSWNSPSIAANITDDDVEDLSTVFLNIVKHYNEGWPNERSNNKKFLKNKIKAIEFWNEPEGNFWKGSVSTYNKLLKATITKIRRYDQSIQIGPNFAEPYGGFNNTGFEFHAIDYLLANVENKSLLPNIYSWHEYIYENPLLTQKLYHKTEDELKKRNLTSFTKQIITEWNPCASGSCTDKPNEQNTWTACDFAETVLIHASLGVKLSAPYPLCAVKNDWGLLSTTMSKNTSSLFWRPQAYAFKMLSQVLHDTPFTWGLLNVSYGGEKKNKKFINDSSYIAAGFTNINKSHVNIIYIANDRNGKYNNYSMDTLKIDFENLIPNATYKISTHRIMNRTTTTTTTGGTNGGKIPTSSDSQVILMHDNLDHHVVTIDKHGFGILDMMVDELELQHVKSPCVLQIEMKLKKKL